MHHLKGLYLLHFIHFANRVPDVLHDGGISYFSNVIGERGVPFMTFGSFSAKSAYPAALLTTMRQWTPKFWTWSC